MCTKEEWKEVVNSLAERFVAEFLKDLFIEKSEVFYPVLESHVAAKGHHHAYVGGLLQHTYEMLKSFDALLKTGLYDKINVDTVALAVLYHDLAKVYEYAVHTTEITDPNTGDVSNVYSIECTDYINLVTHIYGSTKILEDDLNKVNCSMDSKAKILHCILAHHSRKDWGSLMEPKTMEANMVCQLDMLSSKCAMN